MSTNLPVSLPLSDAKARLSEVIRTVRRDREPVVITLDGVPVATLIPFEQPRRDLTAQEVATVRALTEALARIPQPEAPFDAIALIGEGRR